jgi:hypothetical protein
MSPQSRRKWGQSVTPASEEVKRRFGRLSRYMLVFTPVLLILNFLPIDSEPWIWIKVLILGIGTVILLVLAVRFSLWQRDEYWRERGRDPKHPKRWPGKETE